MWPIAHTTSSSVVASLRTVELDALIGHLERPVPLELLVELQLLGQPSPLGLLALRDVVGSQCTYDLSGLTSVIFNPGPDISLTGFAQIQIAAGLTVSALAIRC